MRRTSLAAALVTGCALAASAIASQLVTPQAPSAAASVPSAAPAPTSTALMVQDAAAAAVIGALQAQFVSRDVEFRIDTLEGEPLSLRDTRLEGTGEIRIEGSDAWLPIRFQALYDTATATVLSPAVSLDRTLEPAGPVDTTGAVETAGLDDVVRSKLQEEFASQAVAFHLEDVALASGDERYAVVEGTGTAAFEGEGEAPVAIQAVFDRQAGTWVQVEYSLDGAMPAVAALAAL